MRYWPFGHDRVMHRRDDFDPAPLGETTKARIGIMRARLFRAEHLALAAQAQVFLGDAKAIVKAEILGGTNARTRGRPNTELGSKHKCSVTEKCGREGEERKELAASE